MKEYISYFWLSIQITLSLCSDLMAPVLGFMRDML